MNLRVLFTTAVVGATMPAAAMGPLVASAAHAAPSSGIKWSCRYQGGGPGNEALDVTINAPGVGKTFKMGTGFGSGNGTEYGGITTGLEQSLTSLTLVSETHLTPGWTAVINQAGPPKVVVQFTNTGGGGLPPNTYRLRSFFSIETTPRTPGAYYIVENFALCVPAT